MTTWSAPPVDPDRDLTLTRIVDVPVEAVWDAWTDPEQVKVWFTPAPYTTPGCKIDLRPGGVFRTVMRSPDGDEFASEGSYLHVAPPRQLVWTSALGGGFRPHARPELPFTAVITLEPVGQSTRYTAHVLHADAAGRAEHDRMGFHQGWSAALDQLVAMVERRTGTDREGPVRR